MISPPRVSGGRTARPVAFSPARPQGHGHSRSPFDKLRALRTGPSRRSGQKCRVPTLAITANLRLPAERLRGENRPETRRPRGPAPELGSFRNTPFFLPPGAKQRQRPRSSSAYYGNICLPVFQSRGPSNVLVMGQIPSDPIQAISKTSSGELDSPEPPFFEMIRMC